MSPKPSAASRPEFFVDRSLGRSTTAHLRQLRWIVHLVNDHFEHDGQFVRDKRWIEYGLLRNLVRDLLTGKKRAYVREHWSTVFMS
jgi:PIN like domain